MKILHVVHGWLPRHAGGTERYAARLVGEQRRAGHDVAVVVGSDGGRPSPRIEERDWEGIPLRVVGRSGLYLDSWYRSWSPDAEALFRDVLGEFRPDVVHVHHWQRLTRSIVETCVRSGYPSVVTLHDVSSTCPKTFRIRDGSFCTLDVSPESCSDCVSRFWFQSDEEIGRLIDLYRDDFRHELDCANAVVAPTRALAELVIRHVPALNGRILVEPLGRMAEAPGVEREDRGEGPLRLATWGSIEPMKGSTLLVDAINRVGRERDDVLLDIWGSGDADYVAELRLSADDETVRFRGPFEPRDLPLHEYDAAVFPSICFESYSFTLDEAFVGGLPTILPDRGGPAERAGGAAVTFAAEDAGALARAISHLAAHRGELEAMRSAIPPITAMEKHAAKLVRLYERAAQEGPAVDRLNRARRRSRERLLAYQNERRDERLYELRGRVDQERDRAEGLVHDVEERDASLEVQRETLEKYAANLADLTTSLKERNDEANRLHVSLTEKASESGRLHAELAERNEECRRLHADLAEANAALRERGESLERVDGSARELEAFLEAERKGRARDAERLAELDRTLRDRQERLEEFAASTGELRKAVGVAEAARDSVVRELQLLVGAADDPVAAVRDRIEALEIEGANAATLKRTVAKMDVMRANLRCEIARVEAEVGRRDEALAAAVAEVERVDGERARIAKRVVGDLRPIAEESAGGTLAGEDPHAIVGHAIANHHRLHGLIRERDELLEVLIERVDEMEREQDRKRRTSRSNGNAEGGSAGWFRQKLAAVTRRRRASRSGRKRLLIVVHDFLPKHNAGTEIYTYKLAKELQAELDVHLLFCEARHELPRYTVTQGEYDGLPYTEVVHNYQWESFEETYHDPRMERIFVDVLDEFAPDLVHIQHLHYFSFEFIPIAKSRGIPVVYTLHEFMLLCARGGQLLREDMEICEQPVATKCADCIRHHRLDGDYGQREEHGRLARIAGVLPDGLKRAFEGFAGPLVPPELGEDQRRVFAAAAQARLDFIAERAKQVDLFISPSAFLRGKFVESGMVEPGRIVHSDNGFDVTPFEGFERRPSDVLRFGFVGTIAPYKGIHVLVDAFNEIHDDGVELQIWGDLETFVEYKDELVPRVRNERIRLMGRFDNHRIAHVLAGLDVLIVPSLWFENSPLTIHEAWLARMPVIASDRGGMAELVADGVNGFHFELGNPEDLREKIRRFIDDRALVRQFGDRPGEVKTIADNAVEILGRYAELLRGAPRG